MQIIYSIQNSYTYLTRYNKDIDSNTHLGNFFHGLTSN